MILALRALGVGDLLTAMPALRALHRAATSSSAKELTLAVPQPLAPLVRRSGAADRCVFLPSAVDRPPTSLRWDAGPPDIAVNLHGKGPQSTDLLRRLRPDRLWAYGQPGAPPWDPHEHEVTRWSRLVESYGCPTRPEDLYLAAPGRRDGPILLHPGAAHPDRQWPVDRFAAVAADLAGRGLPVRVTAGPGERDLALTVAHLASLPVAAVVSDLDLGELADLVGASQLVVCGDTGIAHLATAYRTPSIVLFGPQPPSRWGPPADPRHQALWRPEPGDESATGHPPHPSLRRIEVNDVLGMAAQLLPTWPPHATNPQDGQVT
jgi:ADP-heptose:LPS heptosyltransferase